MNHSRRNALGLTAMTLAVTSVLSGCASQEPDPVLWRQMATFKDPFGQSLVDAIETAAGEALVDDIRGGSTLAGEYWEGDSTADSLGLREGGLVIHDLEARAGGLSFDVMISSGPRDANADPLVESADAEYFGPASVFTCFEVLVSFESRAHFGFDDEDCNPALEETLDAGAQLISINELDG